jgi:hypothetical protein
MSEIDVATQWIYFWNILEVCCVFVGLVGVANFVRYMCAFIRGEQILHFPWFVGCR